MKRLLAHFGSLRTALVLMGLLAAVVLADPSYPWLAPVMALMALNLVGYEARPFQR